MEADSFKIKAMKAITTMAKDSIKIQVFKNFDLKVDIPSLSNDLNIVDFQDWLAKVDRLFEYKGPFLE